MIRRILALALAALLLGAVQAASQPTAQTVIRTALHEGPHADAHALADLPRATAVTISERRGGWYHVLLANGQSGWVPMTSLRFASAGAGGAGSWDKTAYSLFESGRSGASGTTASTGVRGLNTGDIADATPDLAAVDELAQWSVSRVQAQAFAGALPLHSQEVPYLQPTKETQP